VRTLAVDQSLSSLGLRQVGPHRLLSRFTADVVFWALSDAKYPVAARGPKRDIIRIEAHRLRAGAAPPCLKYHPVAAMLDRVLATRRGATSRRGSARQLEGGALRRRPHRHLLDAGGQTADYSSRPRGVA
jgi:hypothetical protein